MGGCAYLSDKQGELIFFRPTKDAWRGYSPDAYAFDEHWIAVGGEGHRLHAGWLAGPDAAGLVLEATFTSVEDMIAHSAWGFLPVTLLLTQKFDTLAKVRDLRMPVLVTHGTGDRIVPFEMGERLYDAVTAPKRFIRVEGAGHHNLSGVAFDEYRAALEQLFGVRRKRA